MKSKINFSKIIIFLVIVFLFGITFFVYITSSKKVQVVPEFSSSIFEVDKYPKAFNPENGRLLFSVLNKDNNRLNLVDYEFLGLNSFVVDRSQRDLRSVDLNNDGILDVFSNVYGKGCFDIKKGIVTKDAKLKFVESNFKLWKKNKESKITCLGGFGETLGIADYNGDGLIDILQTAYERNYLFKNLGNFEFEDVTPDFLILEDKHPRVEGAAFTDINADGYVDILVSDVIALNNGDGTFNNLALPEYYKIADEGILPIDLNNDKYFEIVKLDPSGFLYIYKFSKNNTLHLVKKIILIEHLSTEIVHSFFGISSADFNSDGCEDLVIAGGKPNSFGPILLINDCKLNFSTVITSNISGFFSGPVLAGDFNDDGKPDILNRIHPLHTSIIKLSSNFKTIPLDHKIAPGKTLLLTNMFENENNFKFTFTDSNGKHKLYGHTFLVTGSSYNESNIINRRFFIDGGSGYMQQGSYSKLMFLDPKQCPYSISINIYNVMNSYTLNCDGTYSPRTNEKISSNINLHIEGTFEKNEQNIIANGNFLLDNYGWSLGDSAIVEKVSGGIQLINGKDNSWSYISTSVPVKKGKHYKIIVKAQSISTQPSIRLGPGREWSYLKGEQINDQFEFTFEALSNVSLSLDIFNTSPGKGLKSLINKVKVIKE